MRLFIIGILVAFFMLETPLLTAQNFDNQDVLIIDDPILSPIIPTDLEIIAKLDSMVTISKLFCQEKEYDIKHCILIDISVHSGRNRLFVWDFDSAQIVWKSLVSHGCGDKIWGWDETKEDPILSNKHQSHCSSVGKYKIGKRGYSNWGININYKLNGLDTTNNNAYDRLVVLHGWDYVSETEVFPDGSPEGWGCPAVSLNSMRILDGILKDKKLPVLLWIYKGF